MKFNIGPNDCRFIVNEESKKVICVIEGTESLFFQFVEQNYHIHLSPISDKMNKKLASKLFMPDRFVGVATCSSNDSWDPEIGKLIAFSRLKDKVVRSFFKRANTWFQHMDKWLNDAFDEINELGTKLSHNADIRNNLILAKVKQNEKK